jgi:hypothetical protein
MVRVFQKFSEEICLLSTTKLTTIKQGNGSVLVLDPAPEV